MFRKLLLANRIAFRLMKSPPNQVRHFATTGGAAPLHFVSLYAQLGAVDALLRHGADADRKNILGMTALHCAAMAGHTPICERLLAAGAFPNHRDEFNRTPADWAAASGFPELAASLRKRERPPTIPLRAAGCFRCALTVNHFM